MSLDQIPHQTVTRFGCVGFLIYACGFFVPQMRQLCLFIYTRQDQNELHLKRWFFFAKIGVFCKSIAGPLSEAYTQPYSFGGRIKLIICQIRHGLSVTIHEISTSWKKNVSWGTFYIYNNILPLCLVFINITVCWNFLVRSPYWD